MAASKSRSDSGSDSGSRPPSRSSSSSVQSGLARFPTDKTAKPKAIICCFDGTGNKFGEENSNIVRLLNALVKGSPKEQVIYYQPGIGTYSEHQYYTNTVSQLIAKCDESLALFLNDHVKEGYKFIMQHFTTGDKICLFGFSRGAYIARVLMGMLYKVGLLPADNVQQVDFAFSVYQMTGDKGRELSREFKKTFALPVIVEFVGVWDTVASVGISPTASRHPYTSVDYATKVFRHALALDERRVRFQPQTWNAATLEREQELDVDEPEFPDLKTRKQLVREEEMFENDYVPPKRRVADVKEVWFAGCHSDIGGGSHHDRFQHSLSYISFRWMVREVQGAKCGIIFDKDCLLENYEYDARKQPDYVARYNSLDPEGEVPEPQDFLAPIYDQLSHNKWWWFLEFLPLLTTYQDVNGDWIKERRRNMGDGRCLSYSNDEKYVLVHKSVKDRMDKMGYKPRASNWQDLEDRKMIRWVVDWEPQDPDSFDGCVVQ